MVDDAEADAEDCVADAEADDDGLDDDEGANE